MRLENLNRGHELLGNLGSKKSVRGKCQNQGHRVERAGTSIGTKAAIGKAARREHRGSGTATANGLRAPSALRARISARQRRAHRCSSSAKRQTRRNWLAGMTLRCWATATGTSTARLICARAARTVSGCWSINSGGQTGGCSAASAATCASGGLHQHERQDGVSGVRGAAAGAHLRDAGRQVGVRGLSQRAASQQQQRQHVAAGQQRQRHGQWRGGGRERQRPTDPARWGCSVSGRRGRSWQRRVQSTAGPAKGLLCIMCGAGEVEPVGRKRQSYRCTACQATMTVDQLGLRVSKWRRTR